MRAHAPVDSGWGCPRGAERISARRPGPDLRRHGQNIRAYRERGLLDPPRRQGRAAIYDDYHLAQLQTIDELLGRGFTSAHVAEFFETMRAGGNVAELLGLQRAILRPRPEPRGTDDIAAVRRVEHRSGRRGGRPAAGTRAGSPLGDRAGVHQSRHRTGGGALADPLVYARIVLTLLEASRDGVEALADDVISVLEREVVRAIRVHGPEPGQYRRHEPVDHRLCRVQSRRGGRPSAAGPAQAAGDGGVRFQHRTGGSRALAAVRRRRCARTPPALSEAGVPTRQTWLATTGRCGRTDRRSGLCGHR